MSVGTERDDSYPTLRVIMSISREGPNITRENMRGIERIVDTETPIKGLDVVDFSQGDEKCLRERGLREDGFTIATERTALPSCLVSLSIAGPVRVQTGLILRDEDLGGFLIDWTADQFQTMTEQEQFEFSPAKYNKLIRVETLRGGPQIRRPSIAFAIESPEQIDASDVFSATGMDAEVVSPNDVPSELGFMWRADVPPTRGGPPKSVSIIDMGNDCVSPEELERVLEQFQANFDVLRTAIVAQ